MLVVYVRYVGDRLCEGEGQGAPVGEGHEDLGEKGGNS